MMNRKNAFSYIMWFVYSMAVCVSLFVLASTLSKQAGYSEAVGYGVSGLWLIISGLIVFLIHKLAGNFSGGGEKGRIPALVAESLVVVILFAVGIFLRVQGLAGAGEDASYYELTKVVEGQTIPAVVHGASYIYLQLLHLVYLIFGNKFIAGIWLQIVLQIMAGFFLYRAVRKAAGIFASLVTLGFVVAGPLMIEESLSLSPENLFLAIYAIALYACVKCISGSKSLVSCIVAGVLIAVVCYLDFMGVTLLVVTVVGLLFEKNEDDRSLPERLVGSLLCILSCGAGFVLLIFVDSLVSGKAFGSVIAAWWELYCPSVFSVPTVLKISSASVDVMLLLLLMALGIFGYWCSFYKERQSIWILLAIMLVAIQCFGMTTTEVNGYLNLYIVFAILAGASLTNMFAFGDDDEDLRPLGKMIEKEEKEVTTRKSRVAAAKEEPVAEETVVKERRVPVLPERKPRTVAIEEPDMPKEPVVSKEPEMTKESEAKEAEPKVKFLENPLPLPKKHVKKVLDYDIKLTPGMYHYDVEVDDDDDYDI